MIPNGLTMNRMRRPAPGITVTRRVWIFEIGTENGSGTALASPLVVTIPFLIAITRCVTSAG